MALALTYNLQKEHQMEFFNLLGPEIINSFLVVVRWLHILAGIVWMGAALNALLNSVSFADELKNKDNLNNVQNRIRVVAASATIALITGILHLAANFSFSFYSSWGLCILMGSGLGIIMWLNYIFIIWPQQKLAILSVTKDKAIALTNLKRISQFTSINLIFSLPMLFFMTAASHLAVEVNAKSSGLPLLITFVGTVLGLQVYALLGSETFIKNRRNILGIGLSVTLLLYITLRIFSK